MFVKSKLNSIEVLIWEALIDSNISHDEFVLVKNVLTNVYERKTKNFNDIQKFNLCIKQCYLIV